jgi:undecaprenyl-diphosphatase
MLEAVGHFITTVSGGSVEAARGELTIVKAALLGIVEGVTEYLPISSTGHLVLAERVMGVGERPAEREAADAYAICIQLGAIVAVLALYRRRVAQMVRGLLGRDAAGRRLAANLVIAFLPAAAVGFLLEDTVKRYLFGLWPIVAAWLVGGLAILLVARWRRAQPSAAGLDLPDLAWRGALLVGLGQCLALWPGTSRSLATIVGGLLVGLSLQAAVELSFLLGVLTLGAATGWDLLRHGAAIVAAFGWLSPLAGFAVAALSAAVAVRWLVAWLERHGLALFGWYRVALSVAVALWLLSR